MLHINILKTVILHIFISNISHNIWMFRQAHLTELIKNKEILKKNFARKIYVSLSSKDEDSFITLKVFSISRHSLTTFKLIFFLFLSCMWKLIKAWKKLCEKLLTKLIFETILTSSSEVKEFMLENICFMLSRFMLFRRYLFVDIQMLARAYLSWKQ